MKIEIKLTYRGTPKQCDDWAFAVIGQDPMGELDKPVQLQIGGIVTRGTVTGFACGGSSSHYHDSTITISAEVES